MELGGKVAIVTGGAAGIGRATARRLAAEGSAVVIADLDEEWGRDAVEEVRDAGGRAAFTRVDIATEEGVRQMIETAVTRFGSLHVLVNNAFQGWAGRFPDAPVEEWSRVLDIALRGPMLAIQRSLPAMRDGGAIVNVSSTAGLGPRPHSYPEYATGKAGLIRLTECLAPLAAERNVRVNCVVPDWTATEFVRERFAGMTPEERAEARDGFGDPAPERLLEPDEVAEAIAGLIRDGSLAGQVVVLRCE